MFRVEFSGDLPAAKNADNGKAVYLFRVTVFEPRSGTYYAPNYVLAENGAAALGQAQCALGLRFYCKNSTRDIEERSSAASHIERLFYHVQGWSELQF